MGMLIACVDSDVRLLQCNVNECCVLVRRLRKVPAALYGQGLDMLDATISLPHVCSGIQDEHTHGER